MNINPRHLIRLARMVRRPPSKQRIILWLIVIGIAIIVVGVEQFLG